MSKQPPKWSLRFFRWFCDPDFVEDLEGDLVERFEQRKNQNKSASRLFTMEVVKLFRPGIIRSLGGTYKLNNYGMLKTMFTIAWRNALRHKQFTALNLLGLIIGITTSLIISLFIYNEMTHDTFHEHGDRIYRINQSNLWGDWDELISNTGPNVAVALKEDAPEFEWVTRIFNQGPQVIRRSANNNDRAIFEESSFYAAEENFFKIFSFEFLAGNPLTALSAPKNIILTLETTRRYFGQHIVPNDIINQQLEVKAWDGSWETFTIKGVIKDIPDRSHLQFDMLVSLSSYQDLMDLHEWKWIWTAFSTYGLVYPETEIKALEDKIQAIPKKWAPPTTERIFNQSFEDFTAGHAWKLDLQPLNEIYLSDSPTTHAFGPSGNPLFVKIFGAIGFLVLMLSIINFMNMTTARSSTRSKEIGIRKVMGSNRLTLIHQFILESILYVTIATFFAILFIQLGLDAFNELSDREMDLFDLLSKPWAIGTLLIFIILVGLLSGSYPAFFLSSLNPIQAIGGGAKQGFRGKNLRNSLVVFQFTISIALIVCAFFVQKQLGFTSKMDIGFEKANILQIHNIEQFGFNTEKVKSRLSAIPSITHVGKSFGVPPNVWTGDRYMDAENHDAVVKLSNLRTEEDYLDLLGVDILAGRNFDIARPNDRYKVIINESAARLLGWYSVSEQDSSFPVGKKLALASGNEDEFEVIGLLKDFNVTSLKSKIPPLVIIHQDNDKVWDYGAGLSFFSMRLNPETIKNKGELNDLILKVESELADINPTVPFEYSFLDQEFEKSFRFEQKMSQILNLFTLMALILGCLGLFGLAAFSADQRIKELGIRKVLGASLAELLFTFSSEFTRLILIAIIISCPIAWILMDRWLDAFAYRTTLDWWVFLIAAFTALVIALATISYQSIRVARLNPVETLKDE